MSSKGIFDKYLRINRFAVEVPMCDYDDDRRTTVISSLMNNLSLQQKYRPNSEWSGH